ncbi:MAG TPA: polysaccharide lyase family 8 super-sandwich domain-containing protein [Planctomycetota bacterium]|nr:polysaccharide lyase family 8 super-sandwich domain-containing protein [Planctomycetota bacterium]
MQRGPSRIRTWMIAGAVASGLLCGVFPSLVAEDTDLKTIKQRLLAELLPPAEPASDATAAKAAAESLVAAARRSAAALDADGRWPDVDYADTAPSFWKPAQHLGRLVQLAKACRLAPTDAGLKTKARAALDHWLARDYKNANWWWNDIGVPQSIGQALVLLEPDLTADERKQGLAILARRGPGMTGQNRVWLSGIAITRACLEDNRELAQQAIASIASTLTQGLDEGIQADNSFFQHGACLYSGGYGMPFACDCARFAAYTQGTALAFPAETQAILAAYLLDGQAWMVRGETFDYSAIGREITRQPTTTSTSTRGSKLAEACAHMAQFAGPRQAEFAAAAARLQRGAVGVESEPNGDRYFWCSAFLVHRRPAYYFSVRMARTGLHCSDGLINGENKQSHYLADGATYLFQSGREYTGVFGAWDWRRVPGITARADAPFAGGTEANGMRKFAGAATDGAAAVAGMDWTNPARGTAFPANELSARKAWFCFDKEIVCLGAGITETADHPVLTSVNQCLLNGAVTCSVEQANLTGCDLTGPVWVHADGVGYVFPEKSAVHLAAGPQTGSWHNANDTYPDQPTTLPVFNLWIDHGRKPQQACYVYILVPAIAAADLPAYAKTPPVEVLENTAQLQAVRQSDRSVLGAVFYAAGTLKAPGGPTVTVDQACIVLVRNLPGGRHRIALCKPDGSRVHTDTLTVTIDDTAIPFKIPAGAATGQSIQLEQ